MKLFKSLFAAITFALATTSTFAGSDHHGKGEHKDKADQKATAPSAASMAQGEVKKIDKEAGKVTIKHGEIKNLEMPAMTMVFRVKDAALLDQVKVGDKINFAAEKVNGNYTVMKVEASK